MNRIRVRCTNCDARDVENAFVPAHTDPKRRWCWQCGEKALVIRPTHVKGTKDK